MPSKCCVVNCSSRAERDAGIKFFRFPIIPSKFIKLKPLAEERQRAWLKAINRKDLKNKSFKHSMVCSKHFLSGRSAKLQDVLNPDWIPSMQLGYGSAAPATIDCSRYERMKNRIERKEQIVDHISNVIPDVLENVHESDVRLVQEKACQTEEFYFKVEKEDQQHLIIEQQKMKIKALMEKNTELKNVNLMVRAKLTIDDFKNKPRKIKYYTGLNDFDTMEVVLNHVEDSLPINLNFKMSKFDIFLMTFTKLRLDWPLTHLAFQYNVSTKTISNLFHKAIVAIHNKLSCFVFWPDKEASIKNSSMIFKQLFGSKPIFIIDCFEICCERPGNDLARSNTFSAYKHHQTLKYLICISSFGMISFISKGYGGRCSDKFIFESCGILDFITEGDIILADRGFLIESSICAKKARLIMPSFKNGRSQLEPMAIENTRNISSVRIHVEQVIGVLRQKFLITTNRQPITSISKKINDNMYYDYIMMISCAVFNLNPTILSAPVK